MTAIREARACTHKMRESPMSALAHFADSSRTSPQVRELPFPDHAPQLLLARAALAALLGDAASDAPAATTQGRWLVGVIIAARVDHNRALLNVGHSEVRHYHGLRGLAASIDGQHWHVALVAL